LAELQNPIDIMIPSHSVTIGLRSPRCSPIKDFWLEESTNVNEAFIKALAAAFKLAALAGQ
jgi:hypothetical protein